MKEGLRSGKLKVEKEKGCSKQIVVEKKGDDELKQGAEETPHLVSEGGDEPERELVGGMSETANVGVAEIVKKGVDGKVPIVGRVLRSRVVANGGGDKAESEREIGKRRRLVDDGLENKKVKEEEVGGKVQIACRVLRSRTVVNGGGEKRRKRRLVKNGENIVDDGLENNKGKEEVDGKVPIAVRVLRSRTVVNGGCDKAGSDGDKAESDGDNAKSGCDKAMSGCDKAEIGGDKAESDGDKAKSGCDKAMSGCDKAESDGDKAESGCDKAEIGGDKAESGGYKAESGGYKAESGGYKAESGGYKAESGGYKAESGGDKAESDGDKAESCGDKAGSDGDKAESDGDKAKSGCDKAMSGCDKAESDGDKAESGGDKADIGGDKAESDGDKAKSGCDKAMSGCDKAESDGDKAESGGDKADIGGDKTESGGAKAESGGESNGDKANSDVDMADSENVGVAEFGKKSRLVGNGEKIDDGGVEKKNVKETEVGGKAPVAGRVLRSRTVVNGGCDKAESDGVLIGESRWKDGFDNKFSEVKKEGGDQLVTGFTKKLKGRRGRPPKVEQEENGRLGGGLKKLKGKRGRPRQAEKEESDLLDGRLRKKLRSEQDSSEVLKGNLDKEGKMYLKRKSGLKSQERVKPNTVTNDSYPKRKRIGKELNVKASSPANRDKKGKDSENEDSGDGEGHEEEKVNQDRNKKRTNNSKDGIRELKREVSNKIVAMILAAGWTIERRQRNGREYMDAVYVCPERKTHWSVTKAYKALQEGCENDDPKVCKNGFKFTPLPPEELSMLRRVVVNKRVGKKSAKKGKGGGEGKNNVKLKKAKDGNTSDEGIEEKRKKKLGKSQKGKRLLLEQGASTSTACEGRLSLVQRHKRQKTQNRKRCALLVRNSENADSENGGYIPYDGKRTVLSWMIDLGTLSLNSKLKYMNRRKRQVLLEGRIARDGIHCGCCKEIISISEFVTHTRSDYSEPLKYIFTESGSSLLQCLLASWNKQEESERRGFHFVEVNREDPNDDTCGICGDGGDLICCDGCPSTFHQSCLEIKKFPSGDWHCVYCSCKFCGMFGNTCQRDGSENTAVSEFLTCHLCEEKYHQCCNEAKDAVNDDSSSPSFCGKNCQELFEKLEMLLGVRHEVEEGFSLTLLRRFDVGDTALEIECDAKLIECNAKLAVAFLIMDECFLPMVDHRSGVNLIHNILYNRGSNFNRLNYGGFFTAILERGDEIICAATIRIHGNYLAEMPFIGTRYMYRRQGMCRRLLTAIESALCSLKVERLVIPAISELRETWTSVFGFKSLEESSKQKMKNMNVLVFPGVDILQKLLLNQLTEANKSPVKGLIFTDIEHLKTKKAVVCNTDEGRLAGFDGEATALCVDEGNDELAAAQSDTQLLCDVPDARAVELGTKRNQPDVLCDTDEGLLAGSDAEATASCRHEATGVSHESLDGTNNTITIPTGSISDVHEQTEDINEYQNSVSVPDVKELELDTKHNQCSISEEERKSHLKSEGTGSAIKVLCASVEGTDNINYNMRIEDDIVKHISSHAEENNASELQNVALVQEAKVSDENIVHSDSEVTSRISNDEENNAWELQNVALVHEGKVSDEDIVHNDSGITTQISHNAKDHNHHDSQHLQVKGSMFCPNEKMLETFEVEFNHSSVQHTSIVTEGVHPDSIKCSDSKILIETSKVDSDVFHQTAQLVPKKADDSKGHSTTLLFGCSISYFSGNGPDTHEVVSTPADNNFLLPSCGANPESNGISKSPDVPVVDLTSNGAQMNTRSLQQSESNSDVDNSSLRQSNLSNTSAVALQCASGGGNSFGASEVTILSNQGKAS